MHNTGTMATKKKRALPETINLLRRKRQIKGRRNDKRVDIYLSPDEKALIENAAILTGVSISQYCASIALEKAKVDIATKKK